MPQLEKHPPQERATNGRDDEEEDTPPLSEFTGDRNRLQWRMDALGPRVQGPEMNQSASSALMLNEPKSLLQMYESGAQADPFRNWVGETFALVTNVTAYRTTGDTPRHLSANVGTDPATPGGTEAGEPPPDQSQLSTAAAAAAVGGGGGASNAALQQASGNVSLQRVPSWPLLSPAHSPQGSGTAAATTTAAAAPPLSRQRRRRRRHTPAGRPWLAMGGYREEEGSGWDGEDRGAEGEEFVLLLPPAECSLFGRMIQFLPRQRHFSI